MTPDESRRAALHAAYEAFDPPVEPREIALDEIGAVVLVDAAAHLWAFEGGQPAGMRVFADPDHPRLAEFRRFHERQAAYYAGDEESEPLAGLLAPDAEWHVPGRNAIAGRYRGREEVLGYFARRRDLADRSFRIAVREAFGAAPGVVTLAYGRASLGESEDEWGTAGVYEFREGLLTTGRLLPLDQAAFDEIWS